MTPAISGGRNKVKDRNRRISIGDLAIDMNHDVEIECRIKRKLPASSHLKAINVAKRIGSPKAAPSMSPAGDAGFPMYSNKPKIIQKPLQQTPKVYAKNLSHLIISACPLYPLF